MVLKTRRQTRYAFLRRGEAFLPFEARPLSRVPFNICPYIKELIRGRREEAAKFQKSGGTLKQWEDHIKELYKKNGWLTDRIRAGKRYTIADPWRMLRDYEDRWRARQPEYSSPWEARYRKMKDFWNKFERTRVKQRGV